MEELIKVRDSLDRQFKTLRLSLTPNCNFACSYCAGDDKTPSLAKKFIAYKSAEELCEYVYAIHKIVNLNKIRLTGGEPLLYPHLLQLVSMLKKDIQIPKVSLTTNGSRLERLAESLKGVGLDSVNVSLDAVDPTVFKLISRRNTQRLVLRGIDSALDANLPIKINCTVMRGYNENQILPILEYAMPKKVSVRYLEFMQMGYYYQNYKDYYVSQSEILGVIAQKHSFRAVGREASSTTSEYITDDGYTFGIIANESSPFCNDCDRLRLDSNGMLYGCLSSHQGFDLKELENLKEDLTTVLQKAILQKQKEKFKGSSISMMAVGG